MAASMFLYYVQYCPAGMIVALLSSGRAALVFIVLF